VQPNCCCDFDPAEVYAALGEKTKTLSSAASGRLLHGRLRAADIGQSLDILWKDAHNAAFGKAYLCLICS